MAVLAPVVNVRVESVAVNVQEPVDVIVAKLNVATPATATALSVPPRVQPVDPVSTIASVAPVPVVSTLPYASSTETLKGVTTTAETTVAGGCVVNTTFVAVPAVIAIAELVTAVREGVVVSVAVSVDGAVPP